MLLKWKAPKAPGTKKCKDEKRYHVIKPSLIGNMEVVTLRDSDGIQHTISFNKFKKEFTPKI